MSSQSNRSRKRGRATSASSSGVGARGKRISLGHVSLLSSDDESGTDAPPSGAADNGTRGASSSAAAAASASSGPRRTARARRAPASLSLGSSSSSVKGDGAAANAASNGASNGSAVAAAAAAEPEADYDGPDAVRLVARVMGNGDSMAIALPRSSTVGDLRRRVARRWGNRAEAKVRLILAGRELKTDSASLASVNLSTNGKIVFVAEKLASASSNGANANNSSGQRSNASADRSAPSGAHRGRAVISASAVRAAMMRPVGRPASGGGMSPVSRALSQLMRERALSSSDGDGGGGGGDDDDDDDSNSGFAYADLSDDELRRRLFMPMHLASLLGGFMVRDEPRSLEFFVRAGRAEMLRVELDVDATVGELRARIAERWQRPAGALRLFLGAHELADDDAPLDGVPHLRSGSELRAVERLAPAAEAAARRERQKAYRRAPDWALNARRRAFT